MSGDIDLEALKRAHDAAPLQAAVFHADRARDAEAKLSKAIELLSVVAEHGAVVYTSADGRVETLHGRIVAFLREAGHE